MVVADAAVVDTIVGLPAAEVTVVCPEAEALEVAGTLAGRLAQCHLEEDLLRSAVSHHDHPAPHGQSISLRIEFQDPPRIRGIHFIPPEAISLVLPETRFPHARETALATRYYVPEAVTAPAQTSQICIRVQGTVAEALV